MRWEGNRELENMEDRRGQRRASSRFAGHNIGLGTLVVALVGGWVLGINPLSILGVLSDSSPVAQQQPAGKLRADDTMARFVSTVLVDA